MHTTSSRSRGPRALLAAKVARRRLSQRAVAQLLGVSQAVVSQWLSGVRTPNRDAASRIQVIFKIPVHCWSYAEKPKTKKSTTTKRRHAEASR